MLAQLDDAPLSLGNSPQALAWQSLFVCLVCGTRGGSTRFRFLPGPSHGDEEIAYLDVLCADCWSRYAPSCLALARREERKIADYRRALLDSSSR